MLQNYNRYKILKVFLYEPLEQFRLREISRMTKIALPSVVSYLKEFQKEEIISKIMKRGIPVYQANRDNQNLRFYQKLSIQYELEISGFIDYLWNKIHPETIILYGSFAKGEAIDSSDIDIYIIGKEIQINNEKYEEKLNKSIHLLIQPDIKKISKELKNNLSNGIILRGYFKVI